MTYDVIMKNNGKVCDVRGLACKIKVLNGRALETWKWTIYRIWNEFSLHTVFMTQVVCFYIPEPLARFGGDIKHTTNFINRLEKGSDRGIYPDRGIIPRSKYEKPLLRPKKKICVFPLTRSELDMCFWNTDDPGGNKVKIWLNSKFHILTLPDPQGHGMSVKCEQPIDELTVQVWLLYDHPNFKYCTLFVSGTELRTDGQTEDPNTRYPRRTFQAGGIKK